MRGDRGVGIHDRCRELGSVGLHGLDEVLEVPSVEEISESDLEVVCFDERRHGLPEEDKGPELGLIFHGLPFSLFPKGRDDVEKRRLLSHSLPDVEE